ncbi:NYN domain-containing protein [Leptolyngbya sp. NK1-12]|uniref:NYN domain-containing protein n=1 Tax=Leptolyngbya sp. NK1-12 TaxID=2547451 RepID=A0AA96WDI6_9CYAN|nr:NYN domain-containing protein [Leptolyngbya sp. NK1-12]MBF2051185.1 NYN domain-containing protein [Elainella sp. C42_A2020_010]WNZ22975.1 NYN domain-containing protein [Leptolyngbya sp. NK1-12]
MIQLIPPRPFQPSSNGHAYAAKPSSASSGEFQGVERTDRGRVVVFIDGASLFYAAMQMEIEIDYTRLLSCLVSGGRLIHAHFYTGVDPSNEKQKGFLYWMQCNGYRVVAKELVQSTTGAKKVNLNVEIAVDLVRLAPYCDTMILVSGDGDLTCALDFVNYQGVQTEVVGLRSMISEHLINVADYYTDLATIKQEIQKRHSKEFH